MPLTLDQAKRAGEIAAAIDVLGAGKNKIGSAVNAGATCVGMSMSVMIDGAGVHLDASTALDAATTAALLQAVMDVYDAKIAVLTEELAALGS